MPILSEFDYDGQPRAALTAAAFDGAAHPVAPAVLAALGIETGRWSLHHRPVSSTPQLTYARELNGLQRRFGAVMSDRLRQRAKQPTRRLVLLPSPMDLPDEHTHEDAEVRVVLEGQVRFVVRAPNGRGWMAIDCEAGEWIALPAGLPHGCVASRIDAIDVLRLFSRRHGWVAQPTGVALPEALLRWNASGGARRATPAPTGIFAIAA